MPLPDRRILRYDFGYGERHTVHLLPVGEIELAKNDPGLYAWYLRVRVDPERPWLDSFLKTFASKTLHVQARGTLGERFKGIIRRAAPPAVTAGSAEGLASACTVFAPALYVGISVHVRERLAQHFKCLTAQLSQGLPKNVDDSEVASDTDAESRSFGDRVARVLYSAKDNGADNLFVKVLYLPDLTQKELRDIEYFVNRSYFPLFGRK